MGKSCYNCGHRSLDKCMASGVYCTTERQYPSVCGVDLGKWIERKGLINRMIEFFYTESTN